MEKEEIIREYPNVKEKLNYLKEIVEDHQEHLQFSQDPVDIKQLTLRSLDIKHILR
ncbi:Protein of unknown function [Bacillus cytotoxicus]|uniref:Uncharacterized protein n=1 Tax=Bacillus cytotoxicus TaxID=580165 RepID=A0AAX2CFX2_9BACI|nr:Protein of unknown function [Bacillus cytotoxicus]